MDELNPPADGVTVDVTTEADDVVLITVTGDIDIATVERIRSAVARATALHAKGLVLDLSGVKFMDSSGIAVLIEARTCVPAIALRRPSPPVQRLLITTGLTGILPEEP